MGWTYQKYDWEEWFSKKFTILMRGVDYHCSQSTMMQQIRNKASALGLRLKLTDTGTEIIIVVVGERGEDEVSRTNQASLPSEHQDVLAEDGEAKEEAEDSSSQTDARPPDTPSALGSLDCTSGTCKA